MKIINLLYYHYYKLAITLKGKDPDDSAKLYLSWVILSVFLPFIILLLFKIGLTKNRLFYFLIGSLFCILIYKLNKRIILSKVNSEVILKRYESMNTMNKFLGKVIAVLLLFIPFIFSFWIMTLMH